MDPFVSCVCPTYNRNKFLPYLIYMFNYQTYPANRRELIILDDSDCTDASLINQEVVSQHNKDNNIKYIYSSERIPLGKKRNMLNKLSKENKETEYIVCFDDDDYYPPERIRTSIQKLRGTRSILCGSSLLHIYYVDIKKIYSLGPFGPRHGTAGTFAYHISLLENYNYDESAEKSEERFFLKDYTAPLVQIDAKKTMLCIAHSSNTCEKRTVLQNNNIKVSNLKLKDFVKDKFLLKFYENLNMSEKSVIDPEIYSKHIAKNFIMPDLNKYIGKNMPYDSILELIREKNTGFSKEAIEYFIKKHTNVLDVLTTNKIIKNI